MTPARPLDRRGLLSLSLGHGAADLCQGAVPALIPFLIAQRGYSYGAAGALLLAVTLGSSIIQPAFGAVSDRLSMAWLMPAGVALSAIGIALAGVSESFAFTAAAVGIGGIGVAAYHPEGARYANYASGDRRGTGMSLFSVGGNAGFALGPILVTPAVLTLGLHGTTVVAIVPAVAAVVLFAELGRLKRLRDRADSDARAAAERADERPRDEWGAFSRLGGVIALRSGVYFGLQSFVPIWYVHHFGLSEAIGNAALTAILVSGAFGTLVGGRLVDRFGRRRVLLWSVAAQLPLLVAFVVSGSTLAFVLLSCAGFVTVMSFSVTVLMGQEYLPNRIGIASGITLGTAIGLGGVAATALGVLADHAGLSAVMWTIAALPVPALLIALTLPPTAQERERRAAQGATARTATAQAASR